MRKEPLSLEEMVTRKRQEEIALSKPKFLSKEERAAEALRKRQEQVRYKSAMRGGVEGALEN